MKPTLFIGSSAESVSIAYAIQENLDDDTFPIVWKQGVFDLSKSTMKALVDQLDETDYAVFVFAPDDIRLIRGQTLSDVRDNVLFEFGLFTGRLGRERTFFVVPRGVEDFRIATDLLGITPATYDPDLLKTNDPEQKTN